MKKLGDLKSEAVFCLPEIRSLQGGVPFDLLTRQKREASQVFVHITIVNVDPVLEKVEGASPLGIQPNGPSGGFFRDAKPIPW